MRFEICGEKARKLAEKLRKLGGLDVKLTPDDCFYLEVEGEVEKIRGKKTINPYDLLEGLIKTLTRAYYAPKILRKLEKENKWIPDENGKGAREAKNLPQHKEYVEALEKIAALLEAAAKELAKRARREERYCLVEIHGEYCPAYEGPTELPARVEHVEGEGKKYAVIEVKYNNEIARVELNIEKYKRYALLANLAAIAMGDAREFYKGRVSHRTTSYFQAAERLMTWALFMPGEYALRVDHVCAVEKGLLPDIVTELRLDLAKIEADPIHRLVFKLARELAGGDLNKVKDARDYIFAASWIVISTILSAPDGKRPSEGIEQMAERMAEATAKRIAWKMAAMEKKDKADDEIMEHARRWVEEQDLEEKYRKALERLRPFLEELEKDEKDGGLGTVSRKDKAYLVGKLVDYGGYVNKKGLHLLVSADTIKKISIELNGVEIRMADVAEAAAKAFSEKGGWRIWIDEEGEVRIGKLSLGPAKDVPELMAVPAFKAIAALMAQKRLEETGENRWNAAS